MDKEASSPPESKATSSTDTGFERKSSATAKGGVKRIRTPDEPDPALPQYPAYRGVRRRSWGKWVSEIKEHNKKSRICLGSFDTPEMAARAYDVAEVYLKGKKHALLNFPELTDHIPQPISLSSSHIQAAAAEAAVAFSSGRSCDAMKGRRRSNEPSSSFSSHQLCGGISSELEPASVELSGQTDTSNSSLCTLTEGVGGSECVVVEEDLFESSNLFTNLAEALLLSPPPLFSIHEEEHNLEEVFLWSDS